MVKSIHKAVEKNLSNITTYQAGIALTAMHRNVQKISNEILKPFGITKMHWLIIGSILDAGSAGIRSSDLADSLSVTMPYLTHTLGILEARGFITKDVHATDGRSKILKMNPDHIATCREIEETLRVGLRNEIYGKVDRTDFVTYMKVVFELSEREIRNS